MTIYERLKRDHETQKKLADEIMDTSGDTAERRRLFREFKREVAAHADAEEQTFYATLMEHPRGQEKLRHSVAEHKEAADLLDELGSTDMAVGAWIQKFGKLEEELEHHAQEEEGEVFELAKRVMSDELANRLARVFDERKAEAMNQPHQARRAPAQTGLAAGSAGLGAVGTSEGGRETEPATIFMDERTKPTI